MRAKVKMPTAAEERRIQAGIAADPDTFAPTDAELAAMRPATAALSPATYADLTAPRWARGPGKRPAKVLVTVRVDQDVAAGLRASGPGWQVRANAALRRLVEGASTGEETPDRAFEATRRLASDDEHCDKKAHK